MDLPDFNKDHIIMDSENKGIIFNLESTMGHPEFIRYFRNRQKLPHAPFKNWSGMFGADLIEHFEMAYQTLSALDNSKYEVYEDDKHPFDKDIPDEEL